MGSGTSIGERIAYWRLRRGKTQEVLAGLVGRSTAWLSQIESGTREIDSLTMLEALAEVLDVDVAQLVGRSLRPDEGGSGAPFLPALQAALLRPDVVSSLIARDSGTVAAKPAPDLRQLRRQLVEANRLYQAGRYVATGELLTTLVGEAEWAAQMAIGADEPAVCGVLAGIYHITAKTLSRVGEPALASTIAERALAAAERAEDPLLIAASAYHLSQAFLRAGDLTQAATLSTAVAESMEGASAYGMPQRVAVTGGLYLTAVVAEARRKDPATARRLLRRAADLAKAVEDGRNDYWLAFGSVNVDLHALACAVELDDPIEAVRHGEAIDLDRIPTELCGRRSQLCIDLARAYAHRRMDADAVTTLLKAERLAPEALRFSQVAHGLIRELLGRRRRTIDPALRGLAERSGAVV